MAHEGTRRKMCLSKVVNIAITHPKRPQGLVALTGLRTLGFKKGRPAGAYPAAVESPQGLVALVGLRTLGFEKGRPAGAYPTAVESHPGFGRPCRATHPGL